MEEYDVLVREEYDEDYMDAITNFDNLAENKLRGVLKEFYDKEKSRNQAWKTCKGHLYEYAIFKAINQVVQKNEVLRDRFKILMGDDALQQYGDRVVIKNWSDIFPDVDILILDKSTDQVKVIASCKTSLRERLTETAFWKRELEKNRSTRDIKVIFITTDKDNELRIDTNRYILLHVIDCTFVTNPEKYKALIQTYERKYGGRQDFGVIKLKVRPFLEIDKYLEEV